ncbi:heavy metal translocating P-type ATPase metal-binding domain-containing protein [Rhodovarius lipocyclicus]|uniref:heavy metal translocating P-type ATPase metal-binding domain-containing protein n=1 Tax=Rhodovarius lipocyclicus TaxID=268410 RepID=UPI00135AC6EB|nr:heavy metal translocating P-type ATPase metal-binding domain-containing protein [Rhodovarius lipocyclicus]
MSVIGRVIPAEAGQTAVCAHCAAPLPAGAARFCCTGCEAAHGLVEGLGLEAFYRRREAEAGTLRPVEAPAAELSAHAERLPDGDHRIDLLVGGLVCGACVWLVEQALAAEPDVISARASLSTRRLTIRWRGGPERADALGLLLARLGFRVAPWSPACFRAAEDKEGRALVRALGIAAFGSMNVMLVSVAVWVGEDMGEATRAAMHWLAMLVALPVVLVAGMPFYRPAWEGLRAGRLTMDLAVSIGVLATTLMSVSETLRNGQFTWFDGATSLLALLLAGRVLNHAGRRRARRAAAELVALQQGTATRVEADGRVVAHGLEAFAPGDRLLVAAGERLGLDATLESPEALLDTAATTGESLPRRFVRGEALPAGAINMGVPFTATVTARVAEGSLAAMQRLLEQAEQGKSGIVSIADKAAKIYMPVAHAVALATFLGWWLLGGLNWQEALVPAVAALIVTCPCGLAIAVPAVQVVAAGALFRRGVLLARPDALERLATARHAVLDKTGTLTEGRPSLLPGAWTADDLRQAASLATASRHPLARALVRACPEAPLAEGVVEIPGHGMELDGTRLGSAAFTEASDPADGMALWLARPGETPIRFRFADELREDAAAAVADLRREGLTMEILSGDAAPAVAAVATQLAIRDWRAWADPAAKEARMAALAEDGRNALMLGDGMNDAAALARAYVSACPAGATSLAQSSADIVLTAEGLAPIPAAIRLARRAQRIARQNIALSLVYNVLAVPMAVAGLVTPLIAAGVMATSSLIVIGNALRTGGDA